jgi:hypothetical protein
MHAPLGESTATTSSEDRENRRQAANEAGDIVLLEFYGGEGAIILQCIGLYYNTNRLGMHMQKLYARSVVL